MSSINLRVPKYLFCLGLAGVLAGCTGTEETSSSTISSSINSTATSAFTEGDVGSSSSQPIVAVPSSSSEPLISSEPSVSSEPSTSSAPAAGECPAELSPAECGSFERGKIDYEAFGCQGCHGDEGQGLLSFPPVKDHQCGKVDGLCADIPKLASYIETSMTAFGGNAAGDDCIDSNASTCATDVATYISLQFAPQAAAGDSDADGILDAVDACPNTALSDLKSIDHTGCAKTNAGSGDGQLMKAINAGGQAASHDSIDFEADQGGSGGTAGGDNAGGVGKSERYGADGETFTYEFDVDNGTYYAKLYFNEAAKEGNGERIFNVEAEGSALLTGVDPYALAGAKSTLSSQTTSQFTVNDGKATLSFIAVTFNPQLSALALYKTANNDGDNDGVPDAQEGKDCPGTQPGASVDAQGCSTAQLDKDNDGISLPEDLCPETAENAAVTGANGLYPGCSDAEIAVDADNDGIPDFADNCSDTAPGKTVGATGCSGKFNLPNGTIVSPQMRLTVNEYINTVKAAFDTNDLPSATHLSDAFGPFGIYKNNAGDNTANFLTAIGTAQTYANALASEYGNKCNWAANGAQCIKDQLSEPLGALLREGELSDPDLQDLAKVMAATLSKGASAEQAVASVIARALIDDRMMYQLELGENRSLSGKSQLLGQEYASRLSYFLHNSPPDEELAQKYGSLVNNDSEIETQASRLMSEQAYKDAVWQFFAEWLRIPVERPESTLVPAPAAGDQCNVTNQCRDAYPGLAQSYDCKNSSSNMSWCECDGKRCDSLSSNNASELSLEESMYEETRRFIDHIIDNDLPFSEVVTADYSFINKALADHYGVPAPTNDWEQYTFPANAKRKGILTHASILTASGGHGKNKNVIFRGKILFEGFFCEIMPPPPINAVNQPIEDRGTHPDCKVCHSVVDPIGHIFDAYDDNGKFDNTAEQVGEIKLDIDIAGAYSDVVELVDELGNSQAFTHCATRQLFRFALGRDANASEEADFTQVRDKVENGSSVNDIIKAIVKSDIFKHVYSKPAPQACVVGS